MSSDTICLHSLASISLLHHCPSKCAWLFLLSVPFQPFSQSQHCPATCTSSTRGAGAALLGPPHTQRRGRGVTSAKSLHSPFCSCSPPQPSLHQQEHPGQGWEEPNNRSPLPSSCSVAASPVRPPQCCTSLCTAQKSPKYKCYPVSCLLLNTETGLISHK